MFPSAFETEMYNYLNLDCIGLNLTTEDVSAVLTEFCKTPRRLRR